MKKLVFIVLVLFILGRVYFVATDDFRLGNVLFDKKIFSRQIHLDDSELVKIKNILNQPFFYLGKGAQSYVFRSSDDQYVIKFFKTKHLRSEKKYDLVESLFQSHQIAMSSFKEESALVYFQSVPSDAFGKEIVLYDKLNFRRIFPLDQLHFVLQKKVEPTKSIFLKLIKERKKDQVIHLAREIFKHYRKSYAKGIYDDDHGVIHNTGFIGDVVVHLDVGKLRSNASIKIKSQWQKDLKVVAKRMCGWIERKHPLEYPEYEREINHLLDEFLS